MAIAIRHKDMKNLFCFRIENGRQGLRAVKVKGPPPFVVVLKWPVILLSTNGAHYKSKLTWYERTTNKLEKL